MSTRRWSDEDEGSDGSGDGGNDRGPVVALHDLCYPTFAAGSSPYYNSGGIFELLASGTSYDNLTDEDVNIGRPLSTEWIETWVINPIFWDRYWPLRRLNFGERCMVMLCLDCWEKRGVVVRVHPGRVSSGFVPSEVKYLKRLSPHNAAPKLVEWFEDGGDNPGGDFVYIVQDYVQGTDLYTLTDVNIPEETVRELMRRLIVLIQTFFNHGVVHGDIKLENVHMGRDDTMRLVDLEFAYDYQPGVKVYNKNGTPLMFPPEKVYGGFLHSNSEAVWQLGMITYNMIFRRDPWEDLTVPKEPREILIQSTDDASVDCVAFIRHCIQWDPTRRPAFGDLLDHPWLSMA